MMMIWRYLKCLWTTHDYSEPCDKLITGNIMSIRCNRCKNWVTQTFAYDEAIKTKNPWVK